MTKSKSEYRYENVWQKVSEELVAEILAFWTAESALPAKQDAAERAMQTVMVMRAKDGTIAAISTAVLKIIPRLGQPLYYYRTFCAAAHRGRHTMIDMLGRAQDALFEYNRGKAEPDAIGVILELESAMLSGHYDEAHNTATGYVFIGRSPRGFNLFVRYFSGFRLKAPQRAS